MNPAKLFKMKQSIDTFSSNHPKFIQFLKAVQTDAVKTDTVIEFNVTTADGKEISSNIKLKESDIAMFQDFSEMMQN